MKEAYDKEMEVHRLKISKLPEDVISSAKSAQVTKKANKVSVDLKKLLKDNNIPKRNLSAYLMFCGDMRPRLAENLSSPDKIRHMAEAWRNASDEVKARYEEKSRVDGERFV